MKRLFLCAALATLPSCAVMHGALNTAGVNTSNVDSALQAGPVIANINQCDKDSQKPVAYPEEISIGGAMALSFAKRIGPTVVDPSPELASVQSYEELVAKYKNTKPSTIGTGARTELATYVNTLGKGLAAFSERPLIDWTFLVLESDVPNAFSAPGGYVFVTTGMLKKLDNEAQLAAVLAHEIGHVSHRHALKAWATSKKISCISGVAADVLTQSDVARAIQALLGDLASLVVHLDGSNSEVSSFLGQFKQAAFDPNGLGSGIIKKLANDAADSIVNKGLGKDAEFEADATATRLLVFAGYDPREFDKLINKLPDGGGFFTPHPSNKDRLANIDTTRKEYEAFAKDKAPALNPAVKAVVK